MKPVIKEIDKDILRKELTADKLIRSTNNGDNELYVFTAHNAPNLMKEVGRIRELAFRDAGGGTGKELDIDYYDTCENPYKQLIVWAPDDNKILGGYRFIECQSSYNATKDSFEIATAHLYQFSQKFKTAYLPYAIELGRSFVHPQYQSTKKGRKALFALDNLWDGLGYLIVANPEVKYFFGKVTMYNSYNKKARELLLTFMYQNFPDNKDLAIARKSTFDVEAHAHVRSCFTANNFDEDYKVLQTLLKENGETIPPLINAYMKISPSMMTLGTSENKAFGGVEETAILITIEDIYPQKKERHLKF